MEISNKTINITSAIIIIYVIWAISFIFGDIDRLPELEIWLFSLIVFVVPFLLYLIIVNKDPEKTHSEKEPKETISATNEKFEDYADRRVREIEEALK